MKVIRAMKLRWLAFLAYLTGIMNGWAQRLEAKAKEIREGTEMLRELDKQTEPPLVQKIMMRKQQNMSMRFWIGVVSGAGIRIMSYTFLAYLSMNMIIHQLREHDLWPPQPKTVYIFNVGTDRAT